MSDQATCIYVLRLLIPVCLLLALSVFIAGPSTWRTQVLQTVGTVNVPNLHKFTHSSRAPSAPARTLIGRPILSRAEPRLSFFRPVPTYEHASENDLRIVSQYLVRVEFPTPIGMSSYLSDLANGGFMQYLPHDAFVVAMDGFSVQKARKHSGVVDVYEVPTRMKIDPNLMQYMATALSTSKAEQIAKRHDASGPTLATPSQNEHKGRWHNPHVYTFYAMLVYGGARWAQDANQMTVQWHGAFTQMKISANIELVSPGKVLVQVTGALALKQAVALIAQHPRVRWIEPYKEVTLRNRDGALAIQSPDANSHIVWQHGILGAGEIIGVADTGIDYDNCFFNDVATPIPAQCVAVPGAQSPNCINHAHRKIVSYRRFPSSDFQDYRGGHGTHVVGSIAGCTTNADTPALAFAQQVMIAIFFTCRFRFPCFSRIYVQIHSIMAPRRWPSLRLTMWRNPTAP